MQYAELNREKEVMTITKNLIKELKTQRKNKSALENAYVRIRVSGSRALKDKFSMGFDDHPTTKRDEAFELNGLAFVVDSKTSQILSDATLDIDQKCLSVNFSY